MYAVTNGALKREREDRIALLTDYLYVRAMQADDTTSGHSRLVELGLFANGIPTTKSFGGDRKKRLAPWVEVGHMCREGWRMTLLDRITLEERNVKLREALAALLMEFYGDNRFTEYRLIPLPVDGGRTRLVSYCVVATPRKTRTRFSRRLTELHAEMSAFYRFLTRRFLAHGCAHLIRLNRRLIAREKAELIRKSRRD